MPPQDNMIPCGGICVEKVSGLRAAKDRKITERRKKD